MIEHLPRGLGAGELVARSRWTLLTSYRPARFFRSVRLEHRLHALPLALIAVAPFAALWITLVLLTEMVVPGFTPADPSQLLAAGAGISGLLTGDLAFVLITPGVVVIGAPFMFMLLPITFRRIHIRSFSLFLGVRFECFVSDVMPERHFLPRRQEEHEGMARAIGSDGAKCTMDEEFD